MDQEPRWWFSVRFSPDHSACVERFETQEQAELHAAMTGGSVPFVTYLLDLRDIHVKYIYNQYLALSERTK